MANIMVSMCGMFWYMSSYGHALLYSVVCMLSKYLLSNRCAFLSSLFDVAYPFVFSSHFVWRLRSPSPSCYRHRFAFCQIPQGFCWHCVSCWTAPWICKFISEVLRKRRLSAFLMFFNIYLSDLKLIEYELGLVPNCMKLICFITQCNIHVQS